RPPPGPRRPAPAGAVPAARIRAGHAPAAPMPPGRLGLARALGRPDLLHGATVGHRPPPRHRPAGGSAAYDPGSTPPAGLRPAEHTGKPPPIRCRPRCRRRTIEAPNEEAVMTSNEGPDGIRASNSDRERVASILRAAATEGL